MFDSRKKTFDIRNIKNIRTSLSCSLLSFDRIRIDPNMADFVDALIIDLLISMQKKGLKPIQSYLYN